MSEIHILTVDVDGERQRYLHEFSEEEFEALMAEVGWKMPRGMHWYHIPVAEYSQTKSKRWTRIEQMPQVVTLDFSVGWRYVTKAESARSLKVRLKREELGG